jgi:Ca-activated chloride channel family protein
VKPAEQPKANLVFLLDVSGSMDEPDKLPLLKAAFRLLVICGRRVHFFAGDSVTVAQITTLAP